MMASLVVVIPGACCCRLGPTGTVMNVNSERDALCLNEMLWPASRTERALWKAKEMGEKTGGGKTRIQLNPQFEQSK